MPKMHLVSILCKGRIFTAFVMFPDSKPVLNSESFEKLTEGMVRRGSSFSIS